MKKKQENSGKTEMESQKESGIGFFLKTGAGISTMEIERERITAGEVSEKSAEKYTGYGVMIGFGYMFWFGKIFNSGLHFEYSYQKYDDKNKNNAPWDTNGFTYEPGTTRPDNSHYWSIYFTFYLI